ncbi:hypothetical protein OEZ85_000446 [Tetradesmus obliquus]|uniref:Orn/Lys/Arg decarboxylases family 1 pyridoxal-P attachment site domain-containing protein n=1 Tax=Tetradesmus obliquus TaxID=3088 RepID=A0ABY8UNK5_TETOB|nr:hypothetical protein OEZ85_000446 [Tetradesmus obliquus]
MLITRLQDKPFHVPGHKRGRALDPGMCQLLGLQPGSGSSSSQQQRNPLQYDLTELAGLDYLSSPTGVIAAAQQAGAATFGADHTWLLVNGCSAGIHAAVMATPEEDALHGVAHCVTPQQLEAGFRDAQQQGLEVAAVLVVSPTYYGAVARVPGQPSSSSSSLSALAAGADLVAQSSHKVLSAMTQAAMLHSQGSRVDPARVSKALQVLQTSSPSYLLLASLDAARRHAATPGTWDTPLAVAAAARAGLAAIPGLLLLQGGSCGSEASVGGWDPLRLVVNVAGLGLSGFDAAQWLEEQHSIVPELATAQLVVLVVGPGSVMGDAEALLHGVELLCPYPPGVPLVFPGELLTPRVLAQLTATLAAGGVVTGAADATLQTLLVVAEQQQQQQQPPGGQQHS